MKFSVLLPTRNRLDLLSYAIETVRRQDYFNWEIIVSDNFSEEDISGYVKSIDDSRIKYYRTNKFIPVTDNWNNALAKSDGDYVIMLGDDDCLMRGYFSTLKRIIEEYDSPDVIYTSALLYAYPGVMPGNSDGFLRSFGNSSIFRGLNKPFWLEKSESMALVNHSINFRVRFDYNMQFFLVSRKLISEMAKCSPFYQSPYPDYYVSNAIMLKAKRILVVPQSLVTIGISPKSFGFYYFNDSESKGIEFLKNIPDPKIAHRLQKVILPGTNMNTSWLLSMETLARNFYDSENLRVNYDRYRFLQICSVYSGLVLGKESARSIVSDLKRGMTLLEHILYGVPLSILATISLILPKKYRKSIAKRIFKATDSHTREFSLFKIEGNFTNILDVFEKIDPVSYSFVKKDI